MSALAGQISQTNGSRVQAYSKTGRKGLAEKVREDDQGTVPLTEGTKTFKKQEKPLLNWTKSGRGRKWSGVPMNKGELPPIPMVKLKHLL